MNIILGNEIILSLMVIIPGTPTMHIGGDGVPATGKAGEWSMFEVTMSGGGQSNIRVEIHGPSKPEVDVNYHSTTSATIRYCLGQPGEYSITIFFNDEAINDCPFKTIIGPAEEGSCKIMIYIVMTDYVQCNLFIMVIILF